MKTFSPTSRKTAPSICRYLPFHDHPITNVVVETSGRSFYSASSLVWTQYHLSRASTYLVLL